MAITIDDAADVVTVINQCTVDPELQEEFAGLWVACLPGIASFPGFVSGSVHVGEDGRSVTVYLQWRSREGHDACLASTDWTRPAEARFRELLDSGRATIDPQVYRIVHTYEPG